MPNYTTAHFIANNHNKHPVAHASWYTMNIFLCEFENWSICYDYRCHVWCNILCCNDSPLGTQFIFNGTCLSICMAGGTAYFSEHQLDIMPWHFGSTQFNHIEHEHLSLGTFKLIDGNDSKIYPSYWTPLTIYCLASFYWNIFQYLNSFRALPYQVLIWFTNSMAKRRHIVQPYLV